MVTGVVSTRSARRAGGVLLVVGTVQYLVAQAVVAAAWRPVYDWRLNSISDLGMTTCGRLVHRVAVGACSPLHPVMNLAFVVSGVLAVAGTVLTWSWWPAGRLRDTALWLWIAAGALKVVVGLVPEDTVVAVHVLGAMNLPLAAVAILLLGLAARRERPAVAALSVVLGVVGLTGCAVFLDADLTSLVRSFGLGFGAVERMIDLPACAWAVAIGLAVARGARSRHPRSRLHVS